MSKLQLFFTSLINISLGCTRINLENSSDTTSSGESSGEPGDADATTSTGNNTSTVSTSTGISGGSSQTGILATTEGSSSSSTSTGPELNTTSGSSTLTIMTENTSTSSTSEPMMHPCDSCEIGTETAACNSDCTESRCGDGKLNLAAGEQCDISDESINHQKSACNIDCTKKGLMVFITSREDITGTIDYTGVWPDGIPDQLTHIDDADMICMELANLAFGPPSTDLRWQMNNPTLQWLPFKAWISTDTFSPAGKGQIAQKTFSTCGNPFILPDGTPIAKSFNDLTTNGLLHHINIDEKFQPLISFAHVWTGTFSDGSPTHHNTNDPFNADCHDWTSTKDAGMTGTAQSSDNPTLHLNQWTTHITLNCKQPYRLYCFEQCPY